MNASTTPPAAADAPHDRFCDLVMKGGITSGVVYPKAIARLSHDYRFRSIGGTSAGAIAATITAAAEYQRRSTGSRAGFDALETLPYRLQQDVSPTWRRKLGLGKQSRLLSLFQPAPATRRLFCVLIGSLNAGGTGRRIAAIAGGLLLSYWPVTLAVLVAAVLLLARGVSAWLALPWLAAALLAGIALWLWTDVTRGLVANRFGLCSGLGEQRGLTALTPWLHQQIQAAAGRSDADAPLTFGDLWRAPGGPSADAHAPANAGAPRSIDLQMFATNLTHGRPYIFPLQAQGQEPTRFVDRERLFWRPDDLVHCLPPAVLAFMQAHSNPYAPDPGADGDPAPVAGLYELPPPEQFPVLLAARMSLSFPLLFSAVPLWAIDFSRPRAERGFRRCWFSDGGIGSNFPIHMFDGLVPRWPTFGINLEEKIEGRPMVYLPVRYDQGYAEAWFGCDQRVGAASSLGCFLSSIVNAAQNWNDNTMARMPGTRDRIARVRLAPDEGGMNLNMPRQRIEALAERGGQAAEALIARYVAPTPDGPPAPGWDQQRLVRLMVLLKTIEARAPGVLDALGRHTPHATAYQVLIERATQAAGAPPMAPPPGFETPLTAAQQAALLDTLAALEHLMARAVDPADSFSFRPIPMPVLRVRPAL